MARIRSIHPGVFTDEAWASISIAARWLAAGLFTEADDNGVFEWKPLQIKMRLFPADPVEVPTLLSELAAAGIVLSFDLSGKRYGAIRNFCKFQRPRKPKSWFPITDGVRAFVALDRVGSGPGTDDDGGVTQKSEPDAFEEQPVQHKSEKSPQMEDGEGEEGGSSTPQPPKMGEDADFAEWYAAYPRHEGRGQARRAYRTARKRADGGTLLRGAQAAHDRFTPPYVPLPASWLNGERWLDETNVVPLNGPDKSGWVQTKFGLMPPDEAEIYRGVI